MARRVVLAAVPVLLGVLALAGWALWDGRSGGAGGPALLDIGAFSRIDQRRFAPAGESYFVIGSEGSRGGGQLAVDFGDGLRLVDLEGRAGTAAWAADGTSLVVDMLVGPPFRTELVRVDSHNGEAVTLVELEDWVSGMIGLDLNPAGDSVVAAAQSAAPAAPTDLYDFDLETGAWEQLTDTPEINEGLPIVLDEDRVVFTAVERSSPIGASALMVLDRRSGEVRRLTPDTIAPQRAAASPDGQLIAILAFEPPGDATRPSLWTLRSDGSGMTRLDQPVGFGPITFTPDGQSIEIGIPGRDLVSYPAAEP